eukprot:scaffold652_cov188-Chaetoceros_neogracile.AAC.13
MVGCCHIDCDFDDEDYWFVYVRIVYFMEVTSDILGYYLEHIVVNVQINEATQTDYGFHPKIWLVKMPIIKRWTTRSRWFYLTCHDPLTEHDDIDLRMELNANTKALVLQY